MSAVSHLPAPVEMRLRFRARPAELRGVRARVSEAARRCGCTESCVDDVVRAVDEACQNVIRHAYGGACDRPIDLALRRESDRVVVCLRDFAAPVAPEQVAPRPVGELRPGGLGTHLIWSLMDECTLLAPAEGRGNVLRMSKRIG